MIKMKPVFITSYQTGGSASVGEPGVSVLPAAPSFSEFRIYKLIDAASPK
jgi:hypothetical protein